MNFTGILLFAGLTVWDTQQLKLMTEQMEGRREWAAGGHRRVSALPGLYQPVLAALAYIPEIISV